MEKEIKLSILIPSVSGRRNTFLPKSLNMLYGQLEILPKHIQDQVEVLYFIDNKTYYLGEKRNLMIDMCNGEYISFVDCDDVISGDYIVSLLKEIKNGPDVITFLVQVYQNGKKTKLCKYSKDFESDHNTDLFYNRLPNHICCVKKDVSTFASFPNITYGEDSGYSKELKKYLKTEIFINKVLYHYDYNQSTSETQQEIKKTKKTFGRTIEQIDVVILSKGDSSKNKMITQRCINTCISTGRPYVGKITVVENSKYKGYKNCEIINIEDDFNYNKFANIGCKEGKSKYVMICNNDLVFHYGWADRLVKSGYDVMSPKCPKDKRQKDIKSNTFGYEVGKHFSGWCFCVKRDVLSKVGGFDEDFGFWFADNSFVKQLEEIDIMPIIIESSRVTHLGSNTLKSLNPEIIDDLTWGQVEKYNIKYNDNLFQNSLGYKKWKEKNV